VNVGLARAHGATERNVRVGLRVVDVQRAGQVAIVVTSPEHMFALRIADLELAMFQTGKLLQQQPAAETGEQRVARRHGPNGVDERGFGIHVCDGWM
jgi:hypothetical protein